MVTSVDSGSKPGMPPVREHRLVLTLRYEPKDAADYSRNRHVPESELRELLEELLNLRHFSEPKVWSVLDNMKDGLAIRAILMANQLVSGLVGWALNHRAGRVAYPVLKASDAENDDPQQYEEKGRNLNFADLATDPVRYRNVIGDLVARMHVMLPPGSAIELAEGLEALNAGETAPLMTKSKTSKRKLSQRFILELRAVGWVKFFCIRYRLKVNEAEAKVAVAFGVERERVHSWGVAKQSAAEESVNPVRVELERRGWETADGILKKLRAERRSIESTNLTYLEEKWYVGFAKGSVEADGKEYRALLKAKTKVRQP